MLEGKVSKIFSPKLSQSLGPEIVEMTATYLMRGLIFIALKNITMILGKYSKT